MSINRKKFHSLLDEMLDLIEVDAAEVDEDEDEDEVEEVKPSKRSKKKSKKKSKSKKKKPVEEDEDEDEDEDEEPSVSLNKVRKAMRAYSGDYGKDAAKELLQEYGVKTLSALAEEDYAALLEDIENAEEEE